MKHLKFSKHINPSLRINECIVRDLLPSAKKKSFLRRQITSCDIDFFASFHSQLQLKRVTRNKGPQNMRYATVITKNILTLATPSLSILSI